MILQKQVWSWTSLAHSHLLKGKKTGLPFDLTPHHCHQEGHGKSLCGVRIETRLKKHIWFTHCFCNRVQKVELNKVFLANCETQNMYWFLRYWKTLPCKIKQKHLVQVYLCKWESPIQTSNQYQTQTHSHTHTTISVSSLYRKVTS